MFYILGLVKGCKEGPEVHSPSWWEIIGQVAVALLAIALTVWLFSITYGVSLEQVPDELEPEADPDDPEQEELPQEAASSSTAAETEQERLARSAAETRRMMGPPTPPEEFFSEDMFDDGLPEDYDDFPWYRDESEDYGLSLYQSDVASILQEEFLRQQEEDRLRQQAAGTSSSAEPSTRGGSAPQQPQASGTSGQQTTQATASSSERGRSPQQGPVTPYEVHHRGSSPDGDRPVYVVMGAMTYHLREDCLALEGHAYNRRTACTVCHPPNPGGTNQLVFAGFGARYHNTIMCEGLRTCNLRYRSIRAPCRECTWNWD